MTTECLDIKEWEELLEQVSPGYMDLLMNYQKWQKHCNLMIPLWILLGLLSLIGGAIGFGPSTSQTLPFEVPWLSSALLWGFLMIGAIAIVVLTEITYQPIFKIKRKTHFLKNPIVIGLLLAGVLLCFMYLIAPSLINGFLNPKFPGYPPHNIPGLCLGGCIWHFFMRSCRNRSIEKKGYYSDNSCLIVSIEDQAHDPESKIGKEMHRLIKVKQEYHSLENLIPHATERSAKTNAL